MIRFSILLTLIVTFSLHANKWDHLFDHAQYQDVKISPDGKHLAIAVISQGKRSLAFMETDTMKLVGGAIMNGKDEAGTYEWINNERVVIRINRRKPGFAQPISYGELYAVNYDGSDPKVIYGARAGKAVQGGRIKRATATYAVGSIIDTLPEDNKHILIKSTPWSDNGDKLSEVYKLNVYTGRTSRKISTAPVPYANFITDTKGNLALATGTDSDNRTQVFLKQESGWKKIASEKFGRQFIPLTIDETGQYLFALDNYNQDKLGLFKFNLSNTSYEHVFSDKVRDISGVERTTDQRSIYAVRVDEGKPVYYLINKDNEEAQIFRSLIATFPNYAISIRNHSEDGSKYVLQVSSDADAGTFYLFDKSQNSIRALFKFFPNIDSNQLARQVPIQFTASDGLTINGYFTEAKSKQADEPAPLIVLVHGGPHARDNWEYYPERLFLAENGYSVLQVNFRGSTGYGLAYQEAGFENWGTAIQQDIYDGVQWAINNKLASADKLCIMGTSFGAYSALQSIIKYPDTYKCSIANAGVYDLPLLFEEGDIPKNSWGESYLEMTLGTNTDALIANSPNYHADKINTPLFLAHGKKDERAPFTHAERLREALDKANKKYEWYAVRNEAHGFFDPKNQKEYMNKVLDFLETHLN
ncbi:alpha/beta hydrolase family protein [Thalassotalea fusca]